MVGGEGRSLPNMAPATGHCKARRKRGVDKNLPESITGLDVELSGDHLLIDGKEVTVNQIKTVTKHLVKIVKKARSLPANCKFAPDHAPIFTLWGRYVRYITRCLLYERHHPAF